MRRGRIFFYLAVIIILAIIGVLVFGQGLLPKPGQTNVPGPTPTEVETVDVVVVQQHISRGQILDPAVLGKVKYPRSMFIETMLTDIDKAKDKLAKIDLEPGYILTSSMLVDSPESLATTGSNAALMVPKGMVAISIPITRLSAVSYAIERGDHVNVIATMAFVDLDTDWQTKLPNLTTGVTAPGTIENSLSALVAVPGGGGSVMGRYFEDATLGQPLYLYPSEAQRSRLMSQTLFQNITVLNLGNFEKATTASTSTTSAGQTSGEPAPAGEQQQVEATPTVDTRPPDVITLIVNPQQAIALNYLVYSGAQITLVLRGVNDDTTGQTDAVTLEYLLTKYNIPVPVKLPYGIEPRMDQVAAPKLPNDTPQPTPVP